MLPGKLVRITPSLRDYPSLLSPPRLSPPRVSSCFFSFFFLSLKDICLVTWTSTHSSVSSSDFGGTCCLSSVGCSAHSSNVTAIVASTLTQWVLVIHFSWITRQESKYGSGLIAFSAQLNLLWLPMKIAVLLLIISLRHQLGIWSGGKSGRGGPICDGFISWGGIGGGPG